MNTHAYSTWLEIDLGAIKQNVKEIKKTTRAQVMAVIKANGYGHGACAVAKAVTEAGATWCGVARMEEALKLRRAGITSEIMILGYTPPALIIEAVQNDIHVAIYDMDKASEYVEILKIFGGRLKAHLKVETGMGRLGMPLSQAADFLMQYQNNDWIQIDGIFTHFARADEPGSGSAQAQLSQFNRFLDQIQQAGLRPGIVHAANSAAVVNFPEAYYDMVRPGIAIFGLDPAPNAPLSGSFKPALTWKARLTSVRVFPRGHGISYGSSYITSKEERIGVVPVGYGDGYRREPGQKVLIQGKEVDVVGRICMDQFMVQLDDVPEARPGDEVVLLGKQGDQQITAMDIANRWGCLHYEVVCGLADRLPRLYFES